MNELDPYPHAPIAEKSVLCWMFRNPSNIARAASEGIDSECFHIPAHREMLTQLIRSRDEGHLTDSGEICVSTFCQDALLRGLLDRMGGPAAVLDVSSYALSMASWNTWTEQLRDCKARRIAKDAAGEVSGANTAEEAIERATDALERMRKAFTPKARSKTAKQAADLFLSNFEACYKSGDMPGISSGIPDIDMVTGGLRAGELWTFGGGPSSGKSVLMYQVGAQFLGEGKVVAVFSMELMAHEIMGRLLTLFTRVPYRSITHPREAKKHELERIRAGLDTLSKTALWVDATSDQTLDSIVGECERIRDIHGRVDLVLVDYVQIITSSRGRNESREQEIARHSSGLKQLAKRLECPVITGSQLNDNGKTRESRAIEQDSDALLIITEEGLLMKKVRNGQRGSTIPILLDGSEQRFRRFSTN